MTPWQALQVRQRAERLALFRKAGEETGLFARQTAEKAAFLTRVREESGGSPHAMAEAMGVCRNAVNKNLRDCLGRNGMPAAWAAAARVNRQRGRATRDRVEAYFARHPGASQESCAQELHLSQGTVARCVRALREQA